ncbi:MAG TPA: TMEM175 family protein [Solirubrobacterales bacterium]
MTREQTAKRREENEVEFSRIVAFSDGVFSIAITLLVLNLSLHQKDLVTDHEIWKALGEQWEPLLSYAISFAVIARFWLNHHRFFGDVVAFDGRLIGLNMLYLALVVLIPFSSEVLGEYGGHAPSVVVYASNLAAVVIVGFLMFEDARRAGLTETDEQTWREGRVRAIFIVAVFLLSIPVAFLDPKLTPFFWLILFLDPTRRIVGAPDEPERFG